jgi:hypothetical protein
MECSCGYDFTTGKTRGIARLTDDNSIIYKKAAISLAPSQVKKFVLNTPTAFYQDPELSTPVSFEFPVDSIFELHGIEGKSAKVVLPNGTAAYMDKETKCNFIKRSWANSQIDIYSEPSEASILIGVLNLGDEFILYYQLKENTAWVKVKLPSGDFGFIKGSSKCITEENLKKTIRTMVNQRNSENFIIKSFAKKGIPEALVRSFYQEIINANKTYMSSPEGIQELSLKYKKRMLYGVLWTVGGLIASAISYSAASSGGTYFVFWGAVLYGIFDLLSGLFGWVKCSQQDKKINKTNN